MSYKSLTLILVFVCFLIFKSDSNAQLHFEIFVDSSEFRTDLASDMGHELKFLATEDRLILLDYENFRVLFYVNGTNFSDNQILNIVGQHSRTQNGQPFDQLSYNRLSNEFSGVLYDERVWISNYTFGELLTFDLDGNYLATYPGRYRVLGTSDTSLYAFRDYSMFRWDTAADTFAYLKDLPAQVNVTQDRYGSNVHIGSNRLCVFVNDSLKVYRLLEYINGQNVDTVFTDSVYAIPYLAITNDKIIWATEYGSNYRVADLNGNNRIDGNFFAWTYLIDFCSDNHVYLTGASSFKKFDSDLNEVASTSRNQYYWAGRFFGGDDQTLYFYDFRDGGFALTPLDFVNGTFHVDEHNEIPYHGWHQDFRLSNPYAFLLSEWPPDTLEIYRFDLQQMTGLTMSVDSAFGFDVVNDTVFALIGTSLRLFDTDGDSLTTLPLSGLESTNLHDLTRDSYVHFAANNEHVFVVYHDTLHIFSHSGEFESLHRYYIRSDEYLSTLLYADETYVYSNWHLVAINIETGEVSSFVEQGAYAGGFIWQNRYWYESGHNIFTYTSIDVMSGIKENYVVPSDYRLFPVYPNPFNPLANIRYRLAEPTAVSLAVFNILGESVETLVNNKQAAGTYQVVWNADRFSSGVYFILLEAGKYRATTKAVLLK